MKNQVYNLAVTDNKRELIIDRDVLIGTKPYTIGTDKDHIDNTISINVNGKAVTLEMEPKNYSFFL